VAGILDLKKNETAAAWGNISHEAPKSPGQWGVSPARVKSPGGVSLASKSISKSPNNFEGWGLLQPTPISPARNLTKSPKSNTESGWKNIQVPIKSPRGAEWGFSGQNTSNSPKNIGGSGSIQCSESNAWDNSSHNFPKSPGWKSPSRGGHKTKKDVKSKTIAKSPISSGWGHSSEPKSPFGDRSSGWGQTSAPKSPFGGRSSGRGQSSAPKSPFGDRSSGWGQSSAPKSPFGGRSSGRGQSSAPKSPFGDRSSGYKSPKSPRNQVPWTSKSQKSPSGWGDRQQNDSSAW